MKRILSRTIALLGIFGSVSAAAITIDGDLSDWGINRSTWEPTPGSGIQAKIEDQTGSGNFRLGPGWGGQAYDAEALYAQKEGDTLFIALVTGHNPRTLEQPGRNSYGAGDFAIDFGRDGTFELGINIKHATSVSAGGVYSFESFGVEGGVYMNPAWAYGLWDSAGNYTDPGSGAAYSPDRRHPTHLTGGTLIGMVSALSYTLAPVTGYGSNQGDAHYIYEMSIPLELLRDARWNGEAFDIHWTQNCANDSIVVDPPGSVPEPGTLALFALAAAGLLVGCKKKKAAS
ncbi:PEP-CTERM sorting domain-containing protein [Candidatus Accumulibacter sp. ACC005]|uniref:PEP-CTERM sorting domain-containing protein n=1 Tax=Candidatus Accumulibacter sp. ACC005 TaxID=2823331 RepID=UPI0025C113C7|nr:PEP-CTERM sorting domain-containing protein [Candidatus Accumulibacter sp. ACC005]